ncbi:GntR family transcriptional regulator [Amycolatopsis acidiphila]|uniref:FadR family transcriptional regulator n=1 Tax=Amycolatopsis acidiphila TaxID=715473 RepID=A0A558AL96_9PSEU|nr:GntR family transcriptional regulator [Amycolatopsis acidiphila]TVT25035.1 FadR family transcriptional regulator [Amycolatopsis acidiphila]UIJ57457.1 GntR family transcriptional regulator [Amycolatopsis acidiphila]GHG84118.1 GntR family transcriptional regulator [Amycolatopsis acidiphila]
MSQPSARLYRGRVADQIVDDLRGQILSGAVPDGARLPSERELAAQYDVSAPTIREAVRVLTAMGLLSTRNGSRTTVTASGDTLLAISIASVVQFEKVTAADVFGLLGALNAYAVEQAVERASDEDIADLRAAAERAAEVGDAESSAAALLHFFVTLSAISHNPLLAALCRFITQIQLGLALELAGETGEEWGRVPRSLTKARMDIVEAVARRDGPAAVQLIREYHAKAVKRVQSSPGAKRIRETDPGLAGLLSSWLGANVGLSNGPDRRNQP